MEVCNVLALPEVQAKQNLLFMKKTFPSHQTITNTGAPAHHAVDLPPRAVRPSGQVRQGCCCCWVDQTSPWGPESFHFARIEQPLSQAPTVFVFGELLDCENIQVHIQIVEQIMIPCWTGIREHRARPLLESAEYFCLWHILFIASKCIQSSQGASLTHLLVWTWIWIFNTRFLRQWRENWGCWR